MTNELRHSFMIFPVMVSLLLGPEPQLVVMDALQCQHVRSLAGMVDLSVSPR